MLRKVLGTKFLMVTLVGPDFIRKFVRFLCSELCVSLSHRAGYEKQRDYSFKF